MLLQGFRLSFFLHGCEPYFLWPSISRVLHKPHEEAGTYSIESTVLPRRNQAVRTTTFRVGQCFRVRVLRPTPKAASACIYRHPQTALECTDTKPSSLPSPLLAGVPAPPSFGAYFVFLCYHVSSYAYSNIASQPCFRLNSEITNNPSVD